MDNNNITQTNKTPVGAPRARNNSLIVAWCAIVLALVGLGFGIYGVVQANRAIGAIEKTLGFTDDSADSASSQTGEITCTLPESADAIKYAYLSDSSQKTIDVYSTGSIIFASHGDGSSTSTTIGVDTSDIMQYIYDNDLDNFSEDTTNNDASDWTWILQISTDNGACMAGGSEPKPAWFNDLTSLIEAKKNS